MAVSPSSKTYPRVDHCLVYADQLDFVRVVAYGCDELIAGEGRMEQELDATSHHHLRGKYAIVGVGETEY